MLRIVIPGTFPSLNEYIAANKVRRGSWCKGNSMKQSDQKRIMYRLPKLRIEHPVILHYFFYCRNRRMDIDNICGYFHKVFQDALVAGGIIPDDGWRYVRGMTDSFEIDSNNPRVEIVIEKYKV